MTAPTEEEMKVVVEFRECLRDLNLQGFLNTDLGLLQWLRARDLHVDKAEEMLRKSLKWRVDNNINSILSWKAPLIFESLCPIKFGGFDRENSPLCYIPFGTWDLRQLSNLGHRDEFVKYTVQLFETLIDQTRGKFQPSGLPVTQYVFLVNVEGLSMRTLACYGAIEMVLEALRSLEANHPETLKSCIVVNGSRVFTAFFAFVKPILSQRTFGKVHIYNKNVDSWRDVLLKTIDKDQIPKALVRFF